MTSTNFSSNADEIRYFIKECLEDGIPKTKDELRQYIDTHASGTPFTSNRFTEAMMSGALKSLLDSNKDYFSPRRGIYQKIISKASSFDFKQQLFDALTQAEELIQTACVVNIISLSPEELASAEQAKEALFQLKKIKSSLMV